MFVEAPRLFAEFETAPSPGRANFASLKMGAI